jgi:hypothetical protein
VLKASERERADIIAYMAQARDERVKLAQKVQTERLNSVVHHVWDVHTTKARWWVITSPTNLYSQKAFPNLDLALTFHVGLCLRTPRQDRTKLKDRWAEPFIACARALDDASEALSLAEEVEDFQAVGMRLREALVSLMKTAQGLVDSEISLPHPKGSDVPAWGDAIGALLFPGERNEKRRGLAKRSVAEAWTFTNWLTHTHSAGPDDAEAPMAVTGLVLDFFSTALIRRVRGVPESCPDCGSPKLSPQRANDPDEPESLYERPACDRCSWRGTPVPVKVEASLPRRREPQGDCLIMPRPTGSNVTRTSKRQRAKKA